MWSTKSWMRSLSSEVCWVWGGCWVAAPPARKVQPALEDEHEDEEEEEGAETPAHGHWPPHPLAAAILDILAFPEFFPTHSGGKVTKNGGEFNRDFGGGTILSPGVAPPSRNNREGHPEIFTGRDTAQEGQDCPSSLLGRVNTP